MTEYHDFYKYKPTLENSNVPQSAEHSLNSNEKEQNLSPFGRAFHPYENGNSFTFKLLPEPIKKIDGI